ncbi:putative F-box/kelch-repeat protein At1g61540 [Morus notabilis]|uniref:putative F-box/kelch-repeat protein At1g61540 n=1 Tax=Morus notabilis TaxID=981085 RepID=UPI000CED3B33|nr:putative F-box/kelch-repeat protein At1g61540 [Morus notabilis]XP_024029377.1 putative F-box/kelch-repeat protein At1g61540 [Morus notabilis]XP_024029378.1 putative F-box/kelch-repeat protein At1g61540 [Morus notabilis]
MCEVNGVLYLIEDCDCTIKWFDERVGVWEDLELVNDRGLLPNYWDEPPLMVNVGGRLVILWEDDLDDDLQNDAVTSDLELKAGVWCAEIEVKKDGDEDGDLEGEVLWSEMVFSKDAWLNDAQGFLCTCMPVSL